jgi:hypothetical protein
LKAHRFSPKTMVKISAYFAVVPAHLDASNNCKNKKTEISIKVYCPDTNRIILAEFDIYQLKHFYTIMY